MIAQVPAERALALRYEEVLADPVKWLGETAAFCKLEVEPARIERAARNIKADRAQAYQSDPDLARFAAAHASALSARGYAVPGTAE